MLVGAEKLTANQLAFVNLSTDALLDEFPKLLNPQHTVIEIVERTENIPAVTKRVRALKQQGYVFALDDYDGDKKWEPLLALVSYIKIEAEEPIIKTTMQVKKLKRNYPHCKIIVERIEEYHQFITIKEAGADYFQGFFFARPEMISYSGIDPSKITVFELLKAISKEALCFDEIHQRVAKDVGVTARILRLANARLGNANIAITSISQAVVYLGEDMIRQFVRVLAVSDLGTEKPTELTKFALVRARLMELILNKSSTELAQQGYLVGLFSMLDAILDVELEQGLIDSGMRNIQLFELATQADTDVHGMTASGMIVINPPWKLKQTMDAVLPELKALLSQPDGFFRSEQLVDE